VTHNNFASIIPLMTILALKRVHTRRVGEEAFQRRPHLPPTPMTCMYPAPHMTCMHAPPHMTCMYPPPHITCIYHTYQQHLFHSQRNKEAEYILTYSTRRILHPHPPSSPWSAAGEQSQGIIQFI